MPIIIGTFMHPANAGIDCAHDFKCLRKAIVSCESTLIKYALDESINNFEIKGELEISAVKSGTNLCELGIKLSGIKSNFDQKTIDNYKHSKLTDVEINRIANGQRKNKQIEKDSYKKCEFRMSEISEVFKEINDVLEIRLGAHCNDKAVAKTDEINAILDSIPELKISETEPEKGESIIQNNPGAAKTNSPAGADVTNPAQAPTSSGNKLTGSKSEQEKKLIKSINTAIMGQKPSREYEEKRKKGMTNDQIGQEAVDGLFSHLKKCGATKCEEMKCENCKKTVLFCSAKTYCTECASASDCNSGYMCMFGICKKIMTKEDFLRLK
jgi:hypothetical protein